MNIIQAIIGVLDEESFVNLLLIILGLKMVMCYTCAFNASKGELRGKESFWRNQRDKKYFRKIKLYFNKKVSFLAIKAGFYPKLKEDENDKWNR